MKEKKSARKIKHDLMGFKPKTYHSPACSTDCSAIFRTNWQVSEASETLFRRTECKICDIYVYVYTYIFGGTYVTTFSSVGIPYVMGGVRPQPFFSRQYQVLVVSTDSQHTTSTPHPQDVLTTRTHYVNRYPLVLQTTSYDFSG